VAQAFELVGSNNTEAPRVLEWEGRTEGWATRQTVDDFVAVNKCWNLVRDQGAKVQILSPRPIFLS
jgi:hypothetical protein